MVNSFSKFLVEEEKTLYFVWGRMNPPTAGHEKLLDFLKVKAGKNPFRIYLTQSEDKSKNPISFADKIKFARKGFPQYGRQIMMNKKLKTIFDAMTSFYNEGFKRIVIVAGNDRVRQYEILLNKYNGVKGKHGFYNFERINVLDAGKRDPESSGVEGVSGTKLRGYAESGDFTKFAQYMPKRLSNSDSKAVYNAVRKGIGLKEEKEFKQKIQLEPVSEIRESYINGDLFKVGDSVVIKESDEVGEVKLLGSNYVIVEVADKRYRKWLDAVEPVENVKTFEIANVFNGNLIEEKEELIVDYKIFPNLQEGKMQRFKNFDEGKNKGLWANIHAKRKRGERPAKPGEKGYPKTLDIEAIDHGDVAKKRIDREKTADKTKHDRMMDRARMRDTILKNKETK